MIKNLLLPNLWGYLEHDFIKIPYRPIPNQGLELFPIERTGGPSPVLGHKRWTSSPLQVLNFRGQVWTAGTVLPVLPIPVFSKRRSRVINSCNHVTLRPF